MALPVPKIGFSTNMLAYYTDDEKRLIDLKRIGVDDEGDHLQEDFGPDGSGATRRYSGAYDQRYAAAFMLVGYAKSYTDRNGKLRISRLLPDSHPEGAKFNWVCTKVHIDPYQYVGVIDRVDFGQTLPRFARAKLTATYELVP